MESIFTLIVRKECFTSNYFVVKASYDMELLSLQETIQQKVVTLLSDPDNVVRQTMLESGITRLCVFFGRQKGRHTCNYYNVRRFLLLTYSRANYRDHFVRNLSKYASVCPIWIT